MPPDMSISMRHTKLKAEEAALIAGELKKPSWESRNEGIHERVSFEDTLWGFDLAGGIYYNTPLRVTFVKPDSRAERAGIKPGDLLTKINGLDTSTLTIQQAHDMILESGIHIKISVTSPDDFEDAYYYYEDPIVDEAAIEEARRLEEEKAKKRRVHAKVSSYWSLQWPWVSRRKPIYRESNCFMVPSKYEEKHRDKYPIRPSQRYFDDIILYNNEDEKEVKSRQRSTRGLRQNIVQDNEEITNGDISDELDDENSNNSNTEHNGEDENAGENEHDIYLDMPENSDNNDEVKEDMVIENKIDDIVDVDKVESVNDVDISNENEITANNLENESLGHNVTNNEATDVEVFNEKFGKSDSTPRNEEDNILDSILSDDGQNLENSESMNVR